MKSEASSRQEFRTGWPLVLAATIGTAVTGAHFQVTGAMMNPLGAAYGWNRSEISLALTIATIIMAVINVPVGIALDRYGPRSILIPGVFAFGIAVVLIGLAGPALWTWYAAYSFFSIMLVPTTVFVWFAAVVSHFQSARGLAFALCLAGSGILTALTPSIVLFLNSEYGVRGTYFALGLGSVVLMLPGALWAVPRGRIGDSSRHEGSAADERQQRTEILRTPLFWQLAVVVLFISVGIGIFSVHFQPMLTDSGLSPAAAARAALYIAPSFIAFALGSGVLLDHFEPRFPTAVIFLLPGLASLLLMNFSGNETQVVIIASLVGATLGASVNCVSFLASYYFHPRHFGFVSGVYFGALGIAIGFGSWFAGLLFDAAKSYYSTFIILIVSSVLAAMMILTARRQALPENA